MEQTGLFAWKAFKVDKSFSFCLVIGIYDSVFTSFWISSGSGKDSMR